MLERSKECKELYNCDRNWKKNLGTMHPETLFKHKLPQCPIKSTASGRLVLTNRQTKAKGASKLQGQCLEENSKGELITSPKKEMFETVENGSLNLAHAASTCNCKLNKIELGRKRVGNSTLASKLVCSRTWKPK